MLKNVAKEGTIVKVVCHFVKEFFWTIPEAPLLAEQKKMSILCAGERALSRNTAT